MARPFLLLAMLLSATPLLAQAAAVNGTSPYASGGETDIKSKDQDEGRYVPNDRDGLAGRGSGADTNRTYGAVIGTTIGSTIGSEIGAIGSQARPR